MTGVRKKSQSTSAVSAGKALRLNAIGEVLIGGEKIKDIKLANVTPELLGAWRDQRMTGESKVNGATVNRELNLLSHVFTTARREWKWLAASPTSDVRRPKPAASRERIPTEDEIERLCNALGFADEPVTTKSQAVAVAYLFAIETAMRAGEICGLIPDWINGAVARLPASISKNGVRRDVPYRRARWNSWCCCRTPARCHRSAFPRPRSMPYSAKRASDRASRG